MEPIRKTIEVPCEPAEAFRVFTAEIDRWWPKDTHSLSAGEGKVALEVAMEPREGGTVSETGYDGDARAWGTVQVWSPPERVAFTWHVGTSPENATTVEVTFRATDRGTRVELVHSGWDEEADSSARDEYESGWATVFEAKYAGACYTAE